MASDVYRPLDKADLAEHFEPEAGEPGSAYPVIRKPLSAAELRRHLLAALERDVRALTPAEAPEPATA
jgi:hypothetical protein